MSDAAGTSDEWSLERWLGSRSFNRELAQRISAHVCPEGKHDDKFLHNFIRTMQQEGDLQAVEKMLQQSGALAVIAKSFLQGGEASGVAAQSQRKVDADVPRLSRTRTPDVGHDKEIGKAVEDIQEAAKLRSPVLIRVPTELQQLAFEVVCSALAGCQRIFLHSGTCIHQLVGSLQVGCKRALHFAEGPLPRAMELGVPAVIAGIDRAPVEVIHLLEAVLAQVFEPGPLPVPDAEGSTRPLMKLGDRTERMFLLPDPVAAALPGSCCFREDGQLSFRCKNGFQLFVIVPSTSSPGAPMPAGLDHSLLSYFVQLTFGSSVDKALMQQVLSRSSSWRRARVAESKGAKPGKAGAPELAGLVWASPHEAFAEACDSCVDDAAPGLLMGPPCSGRLSAWRLWCSRHVAGHGAGIVAHVTGESSYQKLLGSVVPVARENDEAPVHWRDGPLGRAVREGLPILLRNLDLLPLQELLALAPLVTEPRAREVMLDELVQVDPNFCLFATWPSNREVPSFLDLRFRRIVLDGAEASRLACFQVGDRVEYWSDTYQIWMLGIVQRIGDGGIRYDLDVKKGAKALNLRAYQGAGDRVGGSAPSLCTEVERELAAAFAEARAKTSAAANNASRVRILGSRSGSATQGDVFRQLALAILEDKATVAEAVQLLDCLRPVSIGGVARALRRARALHAKALKHGAPSDILKDCLHGMLRLEEPGLSAKVVQEVLMALPIPDLTAGVLKGESRPELVKMLSILHAAQIPVILEGPPGAGKSWTARRFCEAVYGKAQVKVLCMNGALEAEDLFGRLRPQVGATFAHELGELALAISAGDALILEELNLASRDVLQTLADVLANPEEVPDPVTGEVLHAHSGFWVVATQNPQAVSGRSVLPDSLLSRAVRLQVPAFSLDQQSTVLRKSLLASCGGLPDQGPFASFLDELCSLVARPLEQLACDLHLPGLLQRCEIHFDMRARVKLCRRVSSAAAQGCQALPRDDALRRLVRLHLAIFANASEVVECEVAVQHGERRPFWEFHFRERAGGPAEVVVQLRAALDPQLRDELLVEVAALCASQRLLLGQLATAVRFQEPVLLVGPSSFKAHTARLLARMISFHHGPALSELVLSKATDLDTLIGGVEPHTSATFARYCLNMVCPIMVGCGLVSNASELSFDNLCLDDLRQLQAKLDGGQCWAEVEDANESLAVFAQQDTGMSHDLQTQRGGSLLPGGHDSVECDASDHPLGADDVGPKFWKGKAGLRSRDNALDVVRELMQQLQLGDRDGHIFPVCDRGIARHFRLGGMCLLRQFQEVRASVMEGLNAIFELEDEVVQLPQRPSKIHRHPQFCVVATAPFLDHISPAAQSRFTCLHISRPPSYELQTILRVPDGFCATTLRHSVWLRSFMTILCQPTGGAPSWLPGDVDAVLPRATWLMGSPSEVASTPLPAPPLEPYWDKFSICWRKRASGTSLSLWDSQCLRNPSADAIAWHIVSAAECHIRGLPHPAPLIVGPPGVGKSFVCECVARFLGMRFRRVQCSQNIDIEELFGHYTSTAERSQKPTFRFCPGVLSKDADAARKDNSYVIVLLDELNLLDARGMSAVAALLQSAGSFTERVGHGLARADAFHQGDVQVDLSRCIFCAAVNPSHTPSMAGRRLLTASLANCLSICHVALGREELQNMLVQKWGDLTVTREGGSFGQLELTKCAHVLDNSLRGIERLRAMMARSADEKDQAWVTALALHVCMAPELAVKGASLWPRLRNALRQEDGNLPADLAGSAPVVGPRELACIATNASRFVLVSGPRIGGKKTLVRQAAHMAQKQLVELFASPEMREAELLGEFGPTISGSHTDLTFVPGPLLTAVEKGHWVLLANADRLRPAVLERLNSLGETTPSLNLAGGWHVDVHTDFRLLATTSFTTQEALPRFSAAFLNRCAIVHTDISPADAAKEVQTVIGDKARCLAAGLVGEYRRGALSLRALWRELHLLMNVRQDMAPAKATKARAGDEARGSVTRARGGDKVPGSVTEARSGDEVAGSVTEARGGDEVPGRVTEVRGGDEVPGRVTEVESDDEADRAFGPAVPMHTMAKAAASKASFEAAAFWKQKRDANVARDGDEVPGSVTEVRDEARGGDEVLGTFTEVEADDEADRVFGPAVRTHTMAKDFLARFAFQMQHNCDEAAAGKALPEAAGFWSQFRVANVATLPALHRFRNKITIRSLVKWYATNGASDLFSEGRCRQQVRCCSVVLDVRLGESKADYLGAAMTMLRTLEAHGVMTACTAWAGDFMLELKSSPTSAWSTSEITRLNFAFRLKEVGGFNVHTVGVAMARAAHHLERFQGVFGETTKQLVVFFANDVAQRLRRELEPAAAFCEQFGTQILGVHPGPPHDLPFTSIDLCGGNVVERIWAALFSVATDEGLREPGNVAAPSSDLSFGPEVGWEDLKDLVSHSQVPATTQSLTAEHLADFEHNDIVVAIGQALEARSQKWGRSRIQEVPREDGLFKLVAHMLKEQGVPRVKIHAVKKVTLTAEGESAFELARGGRRTEMLWFGSSGVDAETIVRSETGLDYRFSSFGKLGRGLYGAELAVYSDSCYTYTTSKGHRQLLLYEGIVGNRFHLDEAAKVPDNPMLDQVNKEEDATGPLFHPLRKSRTYSAPPQGFDSVYARTLCSACTAVSPGEPMPTTERCICPWTPMAYRPEEFKRKHGLAGDEVLRRRRVSSPVYCLYPRRDVDCRADGEAQPCEELKKQKPQDLPPEVLARPIAIVEYINLDAVGEPRSWRTWSPTGEQDGPLVGEEQLEELYGNYVREDVLRYCNDLILQDDSLPPTMLQEVLANTKKLKASKLREDRRAGGGRATSSPRLAQPWEEEARRIQAELRQEVTRAIQDNEVDWAEFSGQSRPSKPETSQRAATQAFIQTLQGVLIHRAGFIAGCFHMWRCETTLCRAGRRYQEEVKKHHKDWEDHVGHVKRLYETELDKLQQRWRDRKDRSSAQQALILEKWLLGDRLGLLRETMMLWLKVASAAQAAKRRKRTLEVLIHQWTQGKIKSMTHSAFVGWQHIAELDRRLRQKEEESRNLLESTQAELHLI